MIPHFYLGRMKKPEITSTKKGQREEWEAIPSRWYVGSGHGTPADELGAICSECDDGITTVPVFCKNHSGNSYNSYSKYPNHSFWYTVKKSLHPMGKLEGDEEE
jgi:hypothetical protein